MIIATPDAVLVVPREQSQRVREAAEWFDEENERNEASAGRDERHEVAPLALGGNVFDWTADEAASFAILDAFVDAGGTMIDTADVYSAWVPGHKGGESEALIGRWLKRDPAKRDKVVIATKVGFMARACAPTRSRRRATRRWSGWGSSASTFITSTRTMRACRWPTASARSTTLRRGGQDPRHRPQQFHRRAGRGGAGRVIAERA